MNNNPIDFNLSAYIKRCRRFLWSFRLYYLSFLTIILLFTFIPPTKKIKTYAIAIAIGLAIIGIVFKFYVQCSILKCPFCDEPFSNGTKYLSDVPYKCKNCDRIIDANASHPTQNHS